MSKPSAARAVVLEDNGVGNACPVPDVAGSMPRVQAHATVKMNQEHERRERQAKLRKVMDC